MFEQSKQAKTVNKQNLNKLNWELFRVNQFIIRHGWVLNTHIIGVKTCIFGTFKVIFGNHMPSQDIDTISIKSEDAFTLR